jgi:hypothetical protein
MMNLLTFTLFFLSNVPVTLSQNCNTGDVVCELIGLHQDGFLSKHKLQNMTNRIDQTASHLIEQTVELSTLHRTQKTTDVQIIDIRSHLYNNKNHTDSNVLPRLALNAVCKALLLANCIQFALARENSNQVPAIS